MGTRNGALPVKLSKMQDQVTGWYFSTLVDMQPNTCNLCHICIVLHYTGKIMSMNFIDSLYMIYSITCMNNFQVMSIVLKLVLFYT